MKSRLWLVSVFVATGLALVGTLKANAAIDAEQIDQVYSNLDRTDATLDVDQYMQNFDPRYVSLIKGKPSVHFPQVQENVRKNFQTRRQNTRRVVQSAHRIEKLQIKENIALADVKNMGVTEKWFDRSQGIFYVRKFTGTERDVLVRTPNGWKLIASESLGNDKVENGEPQSVTGKLSAQQIATIKASKSAINPWLVYSHNLINQTLIDQIMFNMR